MSQIDNFDNTLLIHWLNVFPSVLHVFTTQLLKIQALKGFDFEIKLFHYDNLNINEVTVISMLILFLKKMKDKVLPSAFQFRFWSKSCTLSSSELYVPLARQSCSLLSNCWMSTKMKIQALTHFDQLITKFDFKKSVRKIRVHIMGGNAHYLSSQLFVSWLDTRKMTVC